MDIKENHSLKRYNTFFVDVKSEYFAEISTVEKLRALFLDPTYKNVPHFVLGGGSNTLFTKDFNGLVIKIAIPGRQVVR